MFCDVSPRTARIEALLHTTRETTMKWFWQAHLFALVVFALGCDGLSVVGDRPGASADASTDIGPAPCANDQ